MQIWKRVGKLALNYGAIAGIAAIGIVLGLWSRSGETAERAPSKPAFAATVAFKQETVPPVVEPVLESESNPTSGSDRNDSADSAEQSKSASAATNGAATSVAPTLFHPNHRCIDMLPSVAKPLEMAELSTPTDGVLWELQAKEGERVDVGQLLALIDNRLTAASVRVAEAGAARQAGLAVAKAKLNLAEQYLKRIEKAHNQNAASGLEMDEAKSRVEEAKAALEEGEELHREAVARLDMEQARLQSHELRAPFTGTVTRIRKNVGETLTRDASLMTLANLSRLRAELYVPLAYLSDFPSGGTAVIVASLPVPRTLQSQIVHVDPIIDAATQTFRVVVEIDNQDLSLPAGFAIRLVDPRSLASTEELSGS